MDVEHLRNDLVRYVADAQEINNHLPGWEN